MKRGDVWTVSGGVYASKPRPAVILQSDQFSETASVTLIPCTTDPTELLLFRLFLQPDAENGLRRLREQGLRPVQANGSHDNLLNLGYM